MSHNDTKPDREKEGLRKRIRRIIRVSRAVTPEFFDLKDSLTSACIDGHIDAGEVVELKKKVTALLMAIESAREVEQVEGE